MNLFHKRSAPDPGEPVEVARYPTEYEALIARSQLEASGIESFVMKDDTGGMNPHMQLTLGVRLLVRAVDAEEAAGVLRRQEEAWGEESGGEEGPEGEDSDPD